MKVYKVGDIVDVKVSLSSLNQTFLFHFILIIVSVI